jgi:hypothetical protein
MGHQPTQPEPICLLSSFPAREPAHVSRPNPYREAFRSLPLPSPGAADGRDPPVSFPLPPDRPRPRLSPARSPPPRRPASRQKLQPPASLFLFSFPAAAPLPRVTCKPRPPVSAPRQRSATACAANPSPSRAPSAPRCRHVSRRGRQKASAAAALEPRRRV